MLQLWILKPLRQRLYSTPTSAEKPANSISNSTKKGVEPRQYQEIAEETTQREDNQITACISLQGDILSYL